MQTVQAMTECLGGVISALHQVVGERGARGKALLQGYATHMAIYKFITGTQFLADVMGILAILSKILQKESITYTEAK